MALSRDVNTWLFDFDVPINYAQFLAKVVDDYLINHPELRKNTEDAAQQAADNTHNALKEFAAKHPEIIILPNEEGRYTLQSVTVTNRYVLQLAFSVLAENKVDVIPASQRIAYGYMNDALAKIIDGILTKQSMSIPKEIQVADWQKVLDGEFKQYSMWAMQHSGYPTEQEVTDLLAKLLNGEFNKSTLDPNELKILNAAKEFLQFWAKEEKYARKQLYDVFEMLAPESVDKAKKIGEKIALTGMLDETSRNKGMYAQIGSEIKVIQSGNVGLIDDNRRYKRNFSDEQFIEVVRSQDPYKDASYLAQAIVRSVPLKSISESISAALGSVDKRLNKELLSYYQQAALQLRVATMIALADDKNIKEEDKLPVIKELLKKVAYREFPGAEKVVAKFVSAYFSNKELNELFEDQVKTMRADKGSIKQIEAFRLALIEQIGQDTSKTLDERKKLARQHIEALIGAYKSIGNLDGLTSLVDKLNSHQYDFLREQQPEKVFGSGSFGKALTSIKKGLEEKGIRAKYGHTQTWNNVLLSTQKAVFETLQHRAANPKTAEITKEEDTKIRKTFSLEAFHSSAFFEQKTTPWLDKYNDQFKMGALKQAQEESKEEKVERPEM